MYDHENGEAKSTRERVLKTLLAHQQCTINEIAEAVDINPISVRHHITKLEADGLVDSAEERHGVGRPRRIYYLTESGREHFPTRYMRLAVRLLDQLKDSAPPVFVDQLFTQMGQEITAEYTSNLASLSIDQRLTLAEKLLTREGFTVDLERQDDVIRIRETNCPYYHVGQNHPEVCTVDKTLISTVLGVPSEKMNCILRGDPDCIYIVPISAILENT